MVAQISPWLQDFTLTRADIEMAQNVLLEREIPMSSTDLARLIVENRVQEEASKQQARFDNVERYTPATAYQVGQRLMFSELHFAIGEVIETRTASNEDTEFTAIGVQFDDASLNPASGHREFASAYPPEHLLNASGNSPLPTNPDELKLQEGDFQLPAFAAFITQLEARLKDDKNLIRVAGLWFPQDLMVEANEGHLHLAEAVLDMVGGGPMRTIDILENIGGIADAALTLQAFSLNYYMNQDARFDEVGPAGEVLWFLRRMEPEAVLKTPAMLRYTPIAYNQNSLSDEVIELEMELRDEHSPLPPADSDIAEATAILIYPHRRCGTLPLNHEVEQIFPRARRTERICITLIDAQDNEEYRVWVVRKDKYVHGLMPLYTKHALPIGSTVKLRRSDQPGKIIIDFEAHRPRSEWVTIITANNNQMEFTNSRRNIGATYDDLLLLGVDDLKAVDALFQAHNNTQQPLATILRHIITHMSRLTAQGSVHAKTLYSAVNVIRRSPPGPILATLENNPDFESVGGQYWKLS
jgi:hypothetical protein